MTNFNHKHWSHRALKVAGWTDLSQNISGGGYWRGNSPGGKTQRAPDVSRAYTAILDYCLPYHPVISFTGTSVTVALDDFGAVEVKLDTCKNRWNLALAQALTMALAIRDGEGAGQMDMMDDIEETTK